jgi:hypothetical protein
MEVRVVEQTPVILELGVRNLPTRPILQPVRQLRVHTYIFSMYSTVRTRIPWMVRLFFFISTSMVWVAVAVCQMIVRSQMFYVNVSL